MLYQPNPALPGMGKTAADNPPFFRAPAEHGLLCDSVRLTTSDGECLHAWFIPVPSPIAPTSSTASNPSSASSSAAAAAAAAAMPAAAAAAAHDPTFPAAAAAAAAATGTPLSRHVPTLLYFHENAGNMGLRLFNIRLLAARLHVNVFILSYRGYGESTGAPSEPGLIADADAALAHLATRPDIDPTRIVVFGRSLGGAVAIATAARYPGVVRGLIVENTFSSIYSLVDSLFPVLAPFKDRILRLRWPSDARIAAVRAPVLVIAAQQDEVVPVSHGEVLLQAAVRAASRVRPCRFHLPPRFPIVLHTFSLLPPVLPPTLLV
jgi:pimeloyl-ACP methyl ester carboxylesterase